MCGEWLFIISVALMSIYRYVCGLNGSLYSNVSPQCRFIAIMCGEWLFIINVALIVDLSLYVCVG